MSYSLLTPARPAVICAVRAPEMCFPGFIPTAMALTTPTLTPMACPVLPPHVLKATVVPQARVLSCCTAPVVAPSPPVAVPVLRAELLPDQDKDSKRVPPKRADLETQVMSDSEPPPLVEELEDVQVVVIAALSVDTDVKPLLEEVSQYFGVEVTRHLAVWNKGLILAEFSRAVLQKERELIRLDGRRVQMSPSMKPRVCQLPPSNALSVRIFFLDPELDYEGTPEQLQCYRKLAEGWTDLLTPLPQSVLQLIEWGGKQACDQMITPRSARRITTHLTPRFRRYYIQLVVRYNSVDTATRVQERIDGLKDEIDGPRVVVRSEYSRQGPVTRSDPAFKPTLP
eukprot:Hpha_TRINITY_DN16664_c2_g1::TRINITY_DN16664_c2_g1_i2::g.180645::m.180645